MKPLERGHLPGLSLVASTVRGLTKSIGEDIYKRPFITIGFSAWLTMLPLAITSTAGWIRRLGGKRWNRLHRLVYLTGMLGPLHYWWLVKADVNRPLTYAAVVALLLGTRAVLESRAPLRCSSRPRSRDARVRSAVGVMARAPSAEGKSRLASHFSPERLRALRVALLADTLRNLETLPDVCIFFTPDDGR